MKWKQKHESKATGENSIFDDEKVCKDFFFINSNVINFEKHTKAPPYKAFNTLPSMLLEFALKLSFFSMTLIINHERHTL